jgi:hypothetical protein
MKSRPRRLRSIELSLTPQQVVVVWLRDATQAGTFEEGARHSPPYRSAVANAVLRTCANKHERVTGAVNRTSHPASPPGG